MKPQSSARFTILSAVGLAVAALAGQVFSEGARSTSLRFTLEVARHPRRGTGNHIVAEYRLVAPDLQAPSYGRAVGDAERRHAG